MITIVRVYDKQKPNTHREYCGRPGKGEKGLLGNPFAANVTHSNRDEVCDKFHTYFHSNIPQRAKELVEIARTTDVELACFCSPKRCHTETIKAYIEEQLNKPVMTFVNGDWVDARTLTM